MLTTVLFVDMVGTLERMVTLGDGRWIALRAQFAALVRQELARHGGKEMDIVIDEALAIFDGAAAAIHCGCAIRDAVQELGIEVRVGVHAGEVEYGDKPLGGITVYIGILISRVAQPGEILTSNTVKELVAGSGITFTDRGTHTLQDLPGEWRLFAPNIPAASARTP